MDIKGLKKEYIGKKLLSIIDIDLDNEIVASTLKKITGDDYRDKIDNAKLLLFEKNNALVFVDFDSDGYRSGDWFLVHIRDMLDKKYTKGIKHINSVVKNIEYFSNAVAIPNEGSGNTECILITTDEYVVRMGQDRSDSYYPRNFFDLNECKESILGIKDYEVVNRK